MIGARDGTEASTVICERSGGKNFRVLLPVLASRVISFKTKRHLMLLTSEVLWFMLVRPGFSRSKIFTEFLELIRW